MEPTSFFLEQVTVDKGSPLTKKFQSKLRGAMKKGNLEKFRSILNSCKPTVDVVNFVDSSGKTLLQVAAGDLRDASIRNDIIEALLSEGADLQAALLHAVRDDNAKTVKILLQFHKHPLETQHRRLSLKRQGCITPLILAAGKQNFQIVKFLLDHGFTISNPSNPHTWCNDSNRKAGEKVGPALCRLNRYRALASPVYISACFLQNVASGPDPVYRACVLNKELLEIAEQEYEFRKEYLELSDGCKEFAVVLLNECRSMEEIQCIMKTKIEERALGNIKGLEMLEFAVSTRNEKFVSHPCSQLILNSEVYKGASFLEKSPWKQALVILLSSVLSPLMFMVWLVFDVCFPSHVVARMFHSPRVKFLIHCGCYQAFLFLLAFTSTQSNFVGYTSADWLVVSFVIGLLVDVIRDCYQQGRVRFFSNRCNWIAVANVIFFSSHYIIWWAGRITLTDNLKSIEEFTKHQPYMIMLFSECFLVIAVLLAFVQNFSYIQANSSTGPLLHAFTQMLMDVAKFFFYFIFVFLAFAVSFTKLYLQYKIAKQHFLVSQASETSDVDARMLVRLTGNMATVFWALFGDIDGGTFEIEEDGFQSLSITGLVLFAIFDVVAVLVALNMLIAILNESYTRISGTLDTKWKFTRTKLWLSWIYKKGVLPPPYNVLYMLRPVCWVVERLASVCCPNTVMLFFKKFTKNKPRKTWKMKRIDEKKRRKLIRRLIMRYLAQTSCRAETGTEPSDSDEGNDNEGTTS